jgi:hypothetical protein
VNGISVNFQPCLRSAASSSDVVVVVGWAAAEAQGGALAVGGTVSGLEEHPAVSNAAAAPTRMRPVGVARAVVYPWPPSGG